MKAKVILDAFPLHDGSFKWTVSGPLNDRQVIQDMHISFEKQCVKRKKARIKKIWMENRIDGTFAPGLLVY